MKNSADLEFRRIPNTCESSEHEIFNYSQGTTVGGCLISSKKNGRQVRRSLCNICSASIIHVVVHLYVKRELNQKYAGIGVRNLLTSKSCFSLNVN